MAGNWATIYDLEMNMQAEFRQVIYVSERTDFSDDSLTNIFEHLFTE